MSYVAAELLKVVKSFVQRTLSAASDRAPAVEQPAIAKEASAKPVFRSVQPPDSSDEEEEDQPNKPSPRHTRVQDPDETESEASLPHSGSSYSHQLSPGTQLSLDTTIQHDEDEVEEEEQKDTGYLSSPYTPISVTSAAGHGYTASLSVASTVSNRSDEPGSPDVWVENSPSGRRNLSSNFEEAKNDQSSADGDDDDDETVRLPDEDSEVLTIRLDDSAASSTSSSSSVRRPTIRRSDLRPLDKLAPDSDYRANIVLSQFRSSGKTKKRCLNSAPSCFEAKVSHHRLQHSDLHKVYEQCLQQGDIISAKIIMGFAYSSSNTITPNSEAEAEYVRMELILQDPNHPQYADSLAWRDDMEAIAITDFIFISTHYGKEELIEMVLQVLREEGSRRSSRTVYVSAYERSDGTQVAAHTRSMPRSGGSRARPRTGVVAPTKSEVVHVKGYVKKNGTVVAPYTRAAAKKDVKKH